MKRAFFLVIASAICLPSCSGLPGSLTVGYTGKAQDGSNYVIGLNLPLGARAVNPAPIPVEASK